MEEIGIDIDFKGIRPNLTFNFDEGFDDFYLIEKEVDDINTLKLQYEEVQAIWWASMEEILQMIDEVVFIPYCKSAIMSVFELKGMHYRCIRE